MINVVWKTFRQGKSVLPVSLIVTTSLLNLALQDMRATDAMLQRLVVLASLVTVVITKADSPPDIPPRTVPPRTFPPCQFY